MPKIITIIQGYHVGRNGKKIWVNTSKPYNFKVTDKTKHLSRAAIGRICKVQTRFGVRRLVITKILHAETLDEVKTAEKREPVLKFKRWHLNNWLSKILKAKTGVDVVNK